jgi:hypothetical protein
MRSWGRHLHALDVFEVNSLDGLQALASQFCDHRRPWGKKRQGKAAVLRLVAISPVLPGIPGLVPYLQRAGRRPLGAAAAAQRGGGAGRGRRRRRRGPWSSEGHGQSLVRENWCGAVVSLDLWLAETGEPLLCMAAGKA